MSKKRMTCPELVEGKDAGNAADGFFTKPSTFII
jgi:hypothetical protein